MTGQLDVLHEITGHNHGNEVRAALGVPISKRGRRLERLTSGITWKSAAIVNYYYGAPGIYEAGAALDPFVKLAYSRPLKGKWKITAFVESERLSNAIADSPIVNEHFVTTTFVGRCTRFEITTRHRRHCCWAWPRQCRRPPAVRAVDDDGIHLELSPRICTLASRDKQCQTAVHAQWSAPREESLCLVIVDRPDIKHCWEHYSQGTYSIDLTFVDDLTFQLRDPGLAERTGFGGAASDPGGPALPAQAPRAVEYFRVSARRPRPATLRMTPAPVPSILLVEDDLRLAELVSRYLESNGFSVGDREPRRRSRRPRWSASRRTWSSWISACRGRMASPSAGNCD